MTMPDSTLSDSTLSDPTQQGPTGLPVADPGQPIDADQSLGDLLGRLTTDFSQLVSTQVELAKVELKEDVAKAGKGAGMYGGAAVTGLLAVLLLSFAAAWGLAEVMPAGVAFLIIGLVWAVVAAVLFLSGRSHMSDLSPLSDTQATVKEDVRWAKRQMS
jgi:uncharacterized membrane protein YqjE